MKIKNQEYAQLLYCLLSQEKETSAKRAIGDFLLLVYDNGDWGKIENIIDAFEDYYQAAEGVTTAKVETAYSLDEEGHKEIVSYLQRIKPETQRIEIEEKVEPQLLGGVKIMVDDILFDGTIKKQLINLKNSLIQ